MTTCDWIRDASPEVVLGILDGAERADVVSHLAGCAACREEVARLTEAVDALAVVAPAMTPSRGFDQRVLEAMGVDPRVRHRRGVRARVGAAAAVLIAAAIIAVLAVVVLRPSGRVALAESAPMIGVKGQTVGEVTVEGLDNHNDRARVTARVGYYGERGGGFHLEATIRSGEVVALGPLQWDEGWLQWSGTVESDPTDVRAVRVVSASGDVLCEGHFED